MLKGKNVVIIKGEKNTPAMVIEYDRVYLENASTDPVESYAKTTEGKTLQLNGKDWSGLRPKGETTEQAENLVPDALAYFQETYPVAKTALEGKTEDEQANVTSNHAWIMLLEAASYGADLWTRNKIQSDKRPSKPVDEATAVAKAIKLVMALNPKLTLEKATVIAKAMTASAEESEEQAA